jgi:hypothetical protein
MVTRLLLVHSPLVGSATWEPVAAQLAGHSYEVGVPHLTGTVAAGPPYCSRQAEVIARSASSQPAILIGRLPRLPLAMFTEVQPPAPQWPDTPAAHLRLSEAYQDHAAQARERGWPVTELASHHLAPLTDSGLVAASLRELLGQLPAPGPAGIS